MKKYLNLILILSAAGLALSAILLYQHYHPDMDMGVIACGKGFKNPCISVGQSEYATIWGVPVAAFGLIFYTFITFMLLVADYTREKYYAIIFGIILPLTAAGIAADIVLASLMVRIGSFCNLCAATYIINIVIFVLLLVMIRRYFSWSEIRDSIKGILMPENPDQKAVLALMVLFTFFMVFSVVAGAGILKIKAGINRPSEQVITRELTSFYSKPVSEIEFPSSSMKAGSNNPVVTIYVFTDFLCSYCYKFYSTEKYILAKYGDRVQFIYYHYPLDSTCNRYEEMLYPESCTASKAMFSAARAGFFEEYFFMHFNNYKDVKENYELKTAMKIAERTADKFQNVKPRLKAFTDLLNSTSFPDEITDNIEFAGKLKINGTPTIYINGREFNGIPHKDILEAIILSELSASKK